MPDSTVPGVSASSPHKAAPTGTAQAFRALNDKAAAWQNPEGVGCQVAALRFCYAEKARQAGYSFKQVPV
ncbi:Putative aquarius [Pseudomonas putida]|uniref:Putative aquarius n=1 Tax=Pseudomonas putida TaxID=303 RepID=A0A1L7NA60_PSEPU|nr:Putative aquarius [Pseudomonas putida]GLO20628.1 hypothetical protein PPUJ20188_40250 [Pseudomonas putida]